MMKILLAFLLAFTFSAASSQTLYKLLPSSSIEVDGTSTMTDWTMPASGFSGQLTWSKEPAKTTYEALKMVSASLTVPVRSLKGRDNTMNDKTYAAFKVEENEEIKFVMTSVITPQGFAHGAGLTMVGTLTMAGASKEIRVPMVISHHADGSFSFAGTAKLNMTQWNMVPPTAFFDSLEVGEEVSVRVNLIFAK